MNTKKKKNKQNFIYLFDTQTIKKNISAKYVTLKMKFLVTVFRKLIFGFSTFRVKQTLKKI